MRMMLLVLSLFFLNTINAKTIRVPIDEPRIQAGINIASNGDTILVAEGRYFENINFKGKSILVASHYLLDGDSSHIARTIIDGSRPTHPDSGSVVFFVSGENIQATLLGFTITNGSGTITLVKFRNEVYKTRGGGGIFCYNASASIRENLIIDNHIAEDYFVFGGGINAQSQDKDTFINIENNKILHNSVRGKRQACANGIHLVGNGRIVGNLIAHNFSDSDWLANGGIACWSEIPRYILIQDNRIQYNIASGKKRAVGGGISVESATTAMIRGNYIAYNELNGPEVTSGGGIHLVYRTSSDTLIGNTIINNRANIGQFTQARGGGIGLTNNSNTSNPLIMENIISGNLAMVGGAIYSKNSRVDIRSNTINNNTDMLWK